VNVSRKERAALLACVSSVKDNHVIGIDYTGYRRRFGEGASKLEKTHTISARSELCLLGMASQYISCG
jgi:hypothetical protein